MLWRTRIHRCVLILCGALLCRANNLNDDILTILDNTEGASTFVSYLQNHTQLTEQLNGGNFTVIVPNNNAFNRSDAATLDSEAIGALLRYHVAQGIFPSSTFSTAGVFPPTLLNDTTYTNVTGGQRVEFKERNGIPTVLSALKMPSEVVQADIFYAGGLIQMVDTVLRIPMSLSDTITQAQLEDLTALLNHGGWLAPSPAFDAAIALPDLTVFGPNDPRFGASFTGFDNLTDDQRLTIFSYHCVAGQVIYSPDLTNNTQFNTLTNIPVTSYDINNKTFINNAQITTKDYLFANGVLQVTDFLLDPSDPSATPSVNQTGVVQEPSNSSGSNLSGGAKAGIAVGVIAFVVILAVIALVYLRWWRRKRQEGSDNKESLERDRAAAAELAGLPVSQVVEAGGSAIYETGGYDKKNINEHHPVEIDGEMVQSQERSRTSQAVTLREDWSQAGSQGREER